MISPKDVELAIQYGVHGIVISNHGGRHLDSMPATLDDLEECAEAAPGRVPIMIDGGIRRSSNIFKALALGAQYCFMGRIAIWGLAVSQHMIDNLQRKSYELGVVQWARGCRVGA